MFRATAFLVTVLITTPAFAQSAPAPVDPQAFRASVAAVRFGAPAAPAFTASVVSAAAPRRREMGIGPRILLTAAAGVGGLYAGAYLGARIEGPCNGCDDPGFKGALIGMPIGTAAAAITTWILTGK